MSIAPSRFKRERGGHTPARRMAAQRRAPAPLGGAESDRRESGWRERGGQ